MNDSLGYNAGSAPVTVFGVMNKANNQSETLARLITLSGGTMVSNVASTAPNGTWDFEGTGPVISTAPATANYIAGGSTDIFSVRTGTAYFSLGASSSLTINVPIMQNGNTGSSPLCNIVGPGNMIFSGTNVYGTAVSGGTGISVQVGFAAAGSSGTAGNLVLAGSLVFPITTGVTPDNKFTVNYGSTLLVSNSANATIMGDLKLGGGTTGSSGTANQTGGTLAVLGVDTANANRSLVIGEYPNETSAYNLSVGSLSVPNGWTYVGWNGTGNLSISGGTATLLGINFGSSSAGGSLNLSGNGLLSIGTSGISNNNANSSATISGGTLQTNSSWSTTLPIAFNGPATVSFNGNTLGFNGRDLRQRQSGLDRAERAP